MSKIMLVNGPNLNTLGQREPEIYGKTTLQEIEQTIQKLVESAGHQFETIQSNSESELVGWIQDRRGYDFLLINAAAFTHTSVALRDAISFSDVPFIEIHISNVYKRESFRHHSYLSDIAIGVIAGMGAKGYELATFFALDYLNSR